MNRSSYRIHKPIDHYVFIHFTFGCVTGPANACMEIRTLVHLRALAIVVSTNFITYPIYSREHTSRFSALPPDVMDIIKRLRKVLSIRCHWLLNAVPQ